MVFAGLGDGIAELEFSEVSEAMSWKLQMQIIFN